VWPWAGAARSVSLGVLQLQLLSVVWVLEAAWEWEWEAAWEWEWAWAGMVQAVSAWASALLSPSVWARGAGGTGWPVASVSARTRVPSPSGEASAEAGCSRVPIAGDEPSLSAWASGCVQTWAVLSPTVWAERLHGRASLSPKCRRRCHRRPARRRRPRSKGLDGVSVGDGSYFLLSARGGGCATWVSGFGVSS
jgi:hypothetical protein